MCREQPPRLRLHLPSQAALFMSMSGQLSQRLLSLLPVTALYMFNILYAWAVLLNLIGCTWLYTARMEGFESSWLTSVGAPSLACRACPGPEGVRPVSARGCVRAWTVSCMHVPPLVQLPASQGSCRKQAAPEAYVHIVTQRHPPPACTACRAAHSCPPACRLSGLAMTRPALCRRAGPVRCPSRSQVCCSPALGHDHHGYSGLWLAPILLCLLSSCGAASEAAP